MNSAIAGFNRVVDDIPGDIPEETTGAGVTEVAGVVNG